MLLGIVGTKQRNDLFSLHIWHVCLMDSGIRNVMAFCVLAASRMLYISFWRAHDVQNGSNGLL